MDESGLNRGGEEIADRRDETNGVESTHGFKQFCRRVCQHSRNLPHFPMHSNTFLPFPNSQKHTYLKIFSTSPVIAVVDLI